MKNKINWDYLKSKFLSFFRLKRKGITIKQGSFNPTSCTDETQEPIKLYTTSDGIELSVGDFDTLNPMLPDGTRLGIGR